MELWLNWVTGRMELPFIEMGKIHTGADVGGVRVENRFSIGHVIFEMTMAIQVTDGYMSLISGKSFRLDILFLKSLIYVRSLKSYEWKGSHEESIKRVHKYIKEKWDK